MPEVVIGTRVSGLKLPTALRDHLFREHRDAFFEETPLGVVPFFITEESEVEGYEWDDLGTYIRNDTTCYAFLPPIYSSNRSLRQHATLVREVKKQDPGALRWSRFQTTLTGTSTKTKTGRNLFGKNTRRGAKTPCLRRTIYGHRGPHNEGSGF